jgi:hypothetical protein
MLLSGYVPVPHKKHFWETRGDTYNWVVAQAMPRNRFEILQKVLHFNDNTYIDPTDRLYKIRPLIDHLGQKFIDMLEEWDTSFSLDEAMEPYYGHHTMKQFIRGKPVRFGFKAWCLAISGGYLLKFKIYTGKSDRNGGPLGASVTENMCISFLPAGSNLYKDNFFTSLNLLEKLKEHQINCTGTIRKDRIAKAPLRDVSK